MLPSLNLDLLRWSKSSCRFCFRITFAEKKLHAIFCRRFFAYRACMLRLGVWAKNSREPLFFLIFFLFPIIFCTYFCAIKLSRLIFVDFIVFLPIYTIGPIYKYMGWWPTNGAVLVQAHLLLKQIPPSLDVELLRWSKSSCRFCFRIAFAEKKVHAIFCRVYSHTVHAC